MNESLDPAQACHDLTVITYSTPDFRRFLDGLAEDCRRLGYRLHHHECDQVFEKVIAAFDYKIGFIRETIIRWGGCSGLMSSVGSIVRFPTRGPRH